MLSADCFQPNFFVSSHFCETLILAGREDASNGRLSSCAQGDPIVGISDDLSARPQDHKRVAVRSVFDHRLMSRHENREVLRG